MDRKGRVRPGRRQDPHLVGSRCGASPHGSMSCTQLVGQKPLLLSTYWDLRMRAVPILDRARRWLGLGWELGDLAGTGNRLALIGAASDPARIEGTFVASRWRASALPPAWIGHDTALSAGLLLCSSRGLLLGSPCGDESVKWWRLLEWRGEEERDASVECSLAVFEGASRGRRLPVETASRLLRRGAARRGPCRTGQWPYHSPSVRTFLSSLEPLLFTWLAFSFVLVPDAARSSPRRHLRPVRPTRSLVLLGPQPTLGDHLGDAEIDPPAATIPNAEWLDAAGTWQHHGVDPRVLLLAPRRRAQVSAVVVSPLPPRSGYEEPEPLECLLEPLTLDGQSYTGVRYPGPSRSAACLRRSARRWRARRRRPHRGQHRG